MRLLMLSLGVVIIAMTTIFIRLSAIHIEEIDLHQHIPNQGFNKNICDLIFIHIPKTGGTMIEDLFKEEYNCSIGRFAIRGDHHVPINDVYKQMQLQPHANARLIEYYEEALSNPKKELFSVVRNPYARYLSYYTFRTAPNFGVTKELFAKITGRCKQYLQDKNFCNDLKHIRSISTFKAHQAAKNNSIWNMFDFCDISTFNKFTVILFRSLLDGLKRHNHERPQTDFIFDQRNASNHWVKYMLRTEQLSEDLIHLLKDNGFTRTIDRNMIEKYRKKSEWAKNCPQLTVNDLNEQSIQLLQQYYAKDFLNFDYSIEWKQ